MTPKHRAHAGLAILAGIVMACSPPLAGLPTPGVVTPELGTPTPVAPPATATLEPTATATLVPFAEHLPGVAAGLGGPFPPDVVSLTSVVLADNRIRRRFNELGVAPVMDAAGRTGVEICYHDGQCAVSLAAPNEFDGLTLDPQSPRTNEMLAAYVDPVTGQEAGYLVRRVVYEDAVDGVGGGTNADAGAKRDYAWGVQKDAAGRPVMVLVEVEDGQVRVVRPAYAFFRADPNNPPQYDRGAETLYIAGQTIVRGVGAEVQKVFTAEQVREKSDAELIAAANIAVPEVIKDRVDFAGMDLEASGVFRGGVGRRYQYDFVLLKDKKTGLIAGVYQLETGKVLHAFGGEFEQDGRKGPLVLVVTDETVLEEGIYLGINDKIGPRDDPARQVTDPKAILSGLIDAVVFKRAFVWMWDNKLAGPDGFFKGTEFKNQKIYQKIKEKAFDRGVVSRMSSEEHKLFVEQAMEDYLNESGERVIVIVARTNPELSWSGLGFSGEGGVTDDHLGERMAYVFEMPTWKKGKGQLPLYFNGMPPGGQLMAGIALIGGPDSIGGIMGSSMEKPLWETEILPRFCGRNPGKDESLTWAAYKYNFECAVVARQVGGGN